MKKFIFLILFAVFISGITLAAFCGGKQMCLMMSGTGLGLGINQKPDPMFQKEANALCMQVCQERMNLVNLLADPKNDSALIHKKIDEIGSLQTSLEKKIADHILSVKKNLTPGESDAYLKKIRRELERSFQQCGIK